MENLTKKQAIVQSLESMNHIEMEKVIDYIKGLLYVPENDATHQELKQKALMEIKEALRKSPELA
ncbi:MAG TPA: hypothetical protein PKL31_12350 [Fulvivirga sp.]|nr:hypothetical protein [Fulvivirga sp.]